MELLLSSEANANADPSPQRRRACVPCTVSKRRCDMARPSCERCGERQLRCRYSASRLYARRGSKAKAKAKAKAGGVAVAGTDAGASPFSILLESGDDSCEGSYGAGGGDYSQSGDGHALNHGHTVRSSSSVTWFLQVERWVIHYTEPRPGPVPVVRHAVVQQYVPCVRKWLHQWLESGHCPMIHKSLFDDSEAPSCIQDAYAALAVYRFKNEHNEDRVMQAIENKANALLADNPSRDLLIDPYISASPLTTLQHLARVLSLTVYQFIRLFDGNIRQRAQAEKNIPLLRSWTSQLWSSVNIDVTVQNAFGGDYLVSQDSADATVKLWRIWILMENVRRAWKVSTYLRCIYIMSRDGSMECDGTIDFTARRGLWDAPSAFVWRRMLEQNDPLFIVPYTDSWLFDATTPKDIDAFGLATMSLMMDSDSMDSWVANSSDTHLEALLRAG